MELDEETLERFIPQFKTGKERTEFVAALKALTRAVNYQTANLYNADPPDHLLQGDCSEIQVLNPKTGKPTNIFGLILSNSCDISPENTRYMPSRILFCPVIALDSYRKYLISAKVDEKKIDHHISAIRGQSISNLIFLPDTSALNYEAIIMLDDIQSVVSTKAYQPALESRKFSMNQFGHYLLLFKISYHFCRSGADA